MPRRHPPVCVLATLILGTMSPRIMFGGLLPSNCLVEGPEIAATPPAPFNTSDVVLTISGVWCVTGSAVVPNLDTVEREDGTVRITATAHIGGLTAISPFQVVVPLGSFAPGTYTVEFLIDALDLAGGPELVATTELVIAPAPDLELAKCMAGRCPGATLLVPYFEVDLENPDGRTALFSMGNARGFPTLTRFVVWSNWGLPALAFNVLLPAHAVKSINLRQVLVSGRLPRSETDPSFPNCSFPTDTLDESALESLRARLTGQADPEDGLCHSSSVEGTSVATGYVTVDTMNGCSDTVLHPGDDGYFDDGGAGLASNLNALWGEFFLLDSADQRSEGLEAVALRADASRFGMGEGLSSASFYGFPYIDNRAPLGFAYRARFINSTNLQATTDLLIWTEGQVLTRYPAAGPLPCAERPTGTVFNLWSRDETGSNASTLEFDSARRAQRLQLKDLDALTEMPFGAIDVCTKNRYTGGVLSPPTTTFQSWVVPILRLPGRLSVGQHATQLESHPTHCY